MNARTFEVDLDVIYDGEDVTLTVSGSVEPLVRGRYFGPPERCYPDEGGEVEITSVTRDGKPWSHELSPKDLERAEDALREQAEDDGPDPDTDIEDDGGDW